MRATVWVNTGEGRRMYGVTSSLDLLTRWVGKLRMRCVFGGVDVKGIV